MSQTNLFELAQQGDVTAISRLMNRSLKPQGVVAKVTLKNGCLYVLVESEAIPNQSTLTEWIHDGIKNLGLSSIEKLKIYGRQTGYTSNAWVQEFSIIVASDPVISNAVAPQNHPYSSDAGKIEQPNSLPTSVYQKSPVPLNTVSVKTTKPEPMSVPVGKLLLLYLLGIGGIIFAISNLSLLDDPTIIWFIVIFIVACLIFISTPQGQEFIVKNSQKTLEQQAEDQASRLAASQRQVQFDKLQKKGLIEQNEKLVFSQIATYKGGVKGYPQASSTTGWAFIAENHFIFLDNSLSFNLPYNRVIEAKLDYFELGEFEEC
uniref:Uncharacterized protein n=1 Tax=Desertifilum tharense IPPAS B-1220 TaxID=1781255 RepID=A0ACD5GY35_9CYAN